MSIFDGLAVIAYASGIVIVGGFKFSRREALRLTTRSASGVHGSGRAFSQKTVETRNEDVVAFPWTAQIFCGTKIDLRGSQPSTDWSSRPARGA
jgi:hypothetical protein